MKMHKEIQETSPNRKYIITFIFFLMISITISGFILFRQDSIPDKASEAIILQAAAKVLNKEPNDLTADDYLKISALDLSGNTFSNIHLIQKFSNLKSLTLNNLHVKEKKNSKVMNLLIRLHVIKASDENFIDLRPLRKLHHLEKLYIIGSPVKNIKPLSNLKNLKELYIAGTPVSDLKPLEKLAALQILWLGNTEVTDLKPLKELNSLQELNFSGTEAGDLEPLRQLNSLRNLSLRKTKVFDLRPIEKLAELQYLSIDETDVSDVESLRQMKNLKELHAINCENITRKQIDDLQEKLQELVIIDKKPSESRNDGYDIASIYAKGATDRNNEIDILQKALSSNPANPDNIRIEYEIAIAMSQRWDPKNPQPLRREEAVEVFKHIINTYKHMDYYNSDTVIGSGSQFLVPRSALTLAAELRDDKESMKMSRFALECIQQTFLRRRDDWASTPKPKEVGLNSPFGGPMERSKWESRVHFWTQRMQDAINGDVFSKLEMMSAEAAVIGFGDRSSDAVKAMEQIISDYPNTPMAKIAAEQIEKIKKNILKE